MTRGLTNYHTHNHYCDGDGTVEDMVRAGLAAGLAGVGISSHGPVPFETYYALRLDELPAYCAEVRAAQRAYAGQIDVALGMELDYIPAYEGFFREHITPLGLDYLIGSVHYVDLTAEGRPWLVDDTADDFAYGVETYWGGDVRGLVTRYYAILREAARFPGVAVMGHIDRIKKWNGGDRYFREGEPWYVAAVEETLLSFREAGVIVELNTAYGKKPIDQCYPAPWVLRRCVELGISLQINSDAHNPRQVAGSFPEAVALLREVGCREVMALEGGRWVARSLDGG